MKKIIITAACLLFASSALAYGPFYIYPADKGGDRPYHWKDGEVRWKYDAGPFSKTVPLEPKTAADEKKCGSVTNVCTSEIFTCGILKCVEQQLATWQKASLLDKSDGTLKSVSTAKLTFKNLGSTGENITAANYNDPWISKAFNERFGLIVFDEDGSIMVDYVCGKEASESCASDARKLLGLTVPFKPSVGGYFSGGVIIFNGLYLDSEPKSAANPEATPVGYSGTILHELGHLLGLDHTQPMEEVLGKSAKSAPTKAYGVPTMYPSLITEDQADLHTDDVAGISFLYPNENFGEKFCLIKGEIKNQANGEPYQGVNVIAYSDESEENAYADARSFVSGVMYPPGAKSGEYTLTGIVPGKPYRVVFEAVLPEFRNFQGGLNPYPDIAGPTANDIKAVSNQVTASGGYKIVECNLGGDDGSGAATKANSDGEEVLIEYSKVITMNSSDAPPPSEEDGGAGDEEPGRKGWHCMLTREGVSPMWGILGLALLAGLFLTRTKKRI